MTSFPTEFVIAPAYGVALALYAGDTAYKIEIQRAPDSGGSPDTGNAETRAIVEGGRKTYIDRLPNDNATRHYRARHVRPKATAGSWTDWVAAKPVLMPEELPNPEQVVFDKVEVTTQQGNQTFVGTQEIQANTGGKRVGIEAVSGAGAIQFDDGSGDVGRIVGNASELLIFGQGSDVTISDSSAGSAVLTLDFGGGIWVNSAPSIGGNENTRVFTIHSDGTDRSHTGDINQTTVETVTIPGNAMGDNGVLYFEASGTLSGTNGDKTIAVEWGGVSILGVAVNSSSTSNWKMDGRIINIANNDQRCTATLHYDGGSYSTILTDTVEDTTSDVDLEFIVNLANASDTVTYETTFVKFESHPLI